MREGSQAPRDKYLKVKDLSIRYWDEGSGEPVLLIHSFGASCEFWRWNFGELAKRFRVVAFDLPGHGKSEKKIPGVSLQAVADFLLAFLEATGSAPAHVIGHSLGGAMALTLALRHPEKVRRMVLVDSVGLGQEMHRMLRLWSVPILGRILSRPLSRDQIRKLYQTLIRREEAVTDEFVEGAYQAMHEPGAQEAVRAVVRVGIDWRGQKREHWEPLVRRLGEIETPTLIVWGARDPLVPISHAHRAARLIPRAKLEIFEKCGHFAHMQYPEKFNRILTDFLSADGY